MTTSSPARIPLHRAYQDKCFTPRKDLPRSPPSRRSLALKCPPGHDQSKSISTNSRSPRRTSKTRNPSSVASRTRSSRPPLSPVTQNTGKPSVTPTVGSHKENLIDVVPPPKKWEIPRTPVVTRTAMPPEKTGTSVSAPFSPVSPRVTTTPSASPPPAPPTGHSPPLPTAVAMPPPLPTAVATPPPLPTVAMPPPLPTTVATPPPLPTTVATPPPPALPSVKSTHPATPPPALPPSSVPSAPEETLTNLSPPIAVGQGPVRGLPGLQCDDNDLAYLQRIANIKHYQQLQSQVGQLDKGISSAAQQKDQLEHEAIKINRDIAVMRAKYQETVSSIQELLSNPAITTTRAESLTPRGAMEATPYPAPPPGGPSPLGSTPQLTNAHVTRLKRAHQLAAAQLERADRELKSKLAEVDREKEKMEAKLREQEAVLRERREKQLSQTRISEERADWERKVQRATKEQAMAEEKLQTVQSELAKLKVTPTLSGSECRRARGPSRAEREKAEQRLRRLILRCDLYTQRHKMLKEMGIHGRKH